VSAVQEVARGIGARSQFPFRPQECRASVVRRPHDVGIRTAHFCIVAETFPPEVNGVAHTLGRLVEHLRRDGHRVTIVRPRQPADGAGAVDEDVTLVRGAALPGYAGLQLGLARPRRLRDLWTHRRPDAIYVATEGPLGFAAVCAARSLGIRVLSGFHTNFHSYADYYRLGLFKSVFRAYLTWFHRRAGGTVVASDALRAPLHAGGVKDVHVLGRGVDGRLFTPDRRCPRLRAEWGVSGTALVALYVGRLAPEKNVPLAIDAFRAIQRVTEARLVLVGDGPARARLQREHPDLIFPGLRTGEDLARHYASADLFLFPSETDTFGNVTLEAMASGLALVAYDYAAARQFVTHGHDGLLATFGDAGEFVRHAVAAARAPRRRAEMGRRARARVASEEWSGVARRFATLLLTDSAHQLNAREDHAVAATLEAIS
jgi:glycosyltransferase involved in cell wall biosynthesis